MPRSSRTVEPISAHVPNQMWASRLQILNRGVTNETVPKNTAEMTPRCVIFLKPVLRSFSDVLNLFLHTFRTKCQHEPKNVKMSNLSIRISRTGTFFRALWRAQHTEWRITQKPDSKNSKSSDSYPRTGRLAQIVARLEKFRRFSPPVFGLATAWGWDVLCGIAGDMWDPKRKRSTRGAKRPVFEKKCPERKNAKKVRKTVFFWDTPFFSVFRKYRAKNTIWFFCRPKLVPGKIRA